MANDNKAEPTGDLIHITCEFLSMLSPHTKARVLQEVNTARGHAVAELAHRDLSGPARKELRNHVAIAEHYIEAISQEAAEREEVMR